ncbi:MAG: hypothetical protein OQL19_10215 [Gammaproteobacteria bacterium]|nr:hypothetical protein [Gammaproteobacteria bacterium]
MGSLINEFNFIINEIEYCEKRIEDNNRMLVKSKLDKINSLSYVINHLKEDTSCFTDYLNSLKEDLLEVLRAGKNYLDTGTPPNEFIVFPNLDKNTMHAVVKKLNLDIELNADISNDLGGVLNVYCPVLAGEHTCAIAIDCLDILPNDLYNILPEESFIKVGLIKNMKVLGRGL